MTNRKVYMTVMVKRDFKAWVAAVGDAEEVDAEWVAVDEDVEAVDGDGAAKGAEAHSGCT